MTGAVELQIEEEKKVNLTMIKHKVIKIIYFSILFLLTMNLSAILRKCMYSQDIDTSVIFDFLARTYSYFFWN
jgi:uncharacterized membrane protein YfbV (UPF0208 family)